VVIEDVGLGSIGSELQIVPEQGEIGAVQIADEDFQDVRLAHGGTGG
jgi:hypothetical protein